MTDGKKKLIFLSLIALSLIILIGVGASFAYFTAATSSEENAVDLGAAVLSLGYSDDISLIKGNIIPSAEVFVDIASKRVDEEGNFIKPYVDEETGNVITENTVCIDDNLYEICSLYTFTLSNNIPSADLPIVITLMPSVNTFENLYFKIFDENLEVLVPKTHISKQIEDEPLENIVLRDYEVTLPHAISDEEPSEATFHVVVWIDEINADQTKMDSGQMFAAAISVDTTTSNGTGITGFFSAVGTE